MIANEVRSHYVRLWGEPSREAHFEVGGNSIEVLKWDANRNQEQVNIYATLGASDHAPRGYGEQHRLEFFVGLKPAKDDITKPLAMVGLDPVLHGSELGHGHSITYRETLWKGTAMQSLLILRPMIEIVPPLVTLDGFHVEFLQLIPIFASEVEFKAKNKAEGLLERWQSANVAF